MFLLIETKLHQFSKFDLIVIFMIIVYRNKSNIEENNWNWKLEL